MQIIYPPIHPARFTDRMAGIALDYEDGTKLTDLLARTHPDAYISVDIPDIWVMYPNPETEEEFAVRMAKYEVALAEYNEWAAKNKDAVAAAKRNSEVQRARQKQREIAEKEQQLARLQKELAQLTRGQTHD